MDLYKDAGSTPAISTISFLTFSGISYILKKIKNEARGQWTTYMKKCLNKRQIIQRHINEPKANKRAFWKKEMTLLNRFLKEFPDQCFWSVVDFYQKFDSLAILASPNWKKFVKKKYLDYNYVVPKYSAPQLEEQKIGQDANIKKTERTISDFLSE